MAVWATILFSGVYHYSCNEKPDSSKIVQSMVFTSKNFKSIFKLDHDVVTSPIRVLLKCIQKHCLKLLARDG